MYNSQLLTKCVLFPVVLFPSGVLCSRYQDVKPVLPLNISGIGVSEADVRSAASPKQKILSATSSAVLTLPSLPYVADSNAIIVSRDLQDEARDVFIQSVSTSSSVQPTAPDAKHTRNVRPGIVFPSVVDLNIVGKDAATEPSSSGIWHKSFPVDGDSRNARQYRDPYLLNINSTNPSRMVSEKKAAPISSVSVPPSSFTALFVQLLHESRFPFRFEGPSVSSAVAREGAGIDGVEVPSGEATFDGVAGDKGDAVEILDRGVLAAEPGWSSTKLVIISALVSFLIFISLPLIVAFAYEYFIMKAKTFYHIDYSRSLDLLDDEGDFAISKWDCFEDLEGDAETAVLSITNYAYHYSNDDDNCNLNGSGNCNCRYQPKTKLRRQSQLLQLQSLLHEQR
eukprot:GEMP01018937.1.p1 GENE.GEMP01018937.1~~GEMP01018937.1.p1  ORF type:complete len:396 (+),score=55.51 GEMP01018937.1:198-1385(+)